MDLTSLAAVSTHDVMKIPDRQQIRFRFMSGTKLSVYLALFKILIVVPIKYRIVSTIAVMVPYRFTLSGMQPYLSFLL